jgi:phage-related protein
MTDQTYSTSRDSDDESLIVDESVTSTAQSIDDEDSNPETEQLVSEIDTTRARMSDTVQAIGEKLDPQNVVTQAKETVREATIGRVEEMASNTGDAIQQTGGGIVETVRSNPIPAAMTAFGLFMLWKNRQSSNGNRDWAYGRYAGPSSRPDLYGRGSYAYGDGSQWQSANGGQGMTDKARQTVGGAADTVGGAVSGAANTVGNTVSGAADTVGQTVSGAADTVGQTVSGVADTASQVPQRAGEVAQRAGWEFDRVLNENPLAIGAVALAAGAAAGLVLPTTPPERRLGEQLAPARDKVIDQAESAAHQALDKVEEQASNV